MEGKFDDLIIKNLIPEEARKECLLCQLNDLSTENLSINCAVKTSDGNIVTFCDKCGWNKQTDAKRRLKKGMMTREEEDNYIVDLVKAQKISGASTWIGTFSKNQFKNAEME